MNPWWSSSTCSEISQAIHQKNHQSTGVALNLEVQKLLIAVLKVAASHAQWQYEDVQYKHCPLTNWTTNPGTMRKTSKH